MSAAEAIRRCPHAVFVRPRHSLYREYSRHVWSTVRGIVPTVEQTGIDEGYLDLGEVARDFLEARVIAEALQTAVRAATSLTCSLGVAPCKVVAKIGSDARKPGGLTVVSRGRRRRSSPASMCAGCPASAPRRRSGCSQPASRRWAVLPLSTTMSCGGCCPAASGRASRPCPRHRSARARPRRSGSRSASRTRSSATSPIPSACTTSCAGWPPRSQGTCRTTGQVARTVTTKLRYADFSIRSRSTSLDVGIDDAAQIGDLACRLLDRGLRDRPGALRLVGVGVSGLVAYRQLTLGGV